MMDIEAFLDVLKKNLSNERYFHSMMVSKMSETLAAAYGADAEKAAFAGLVHDIAKGMKHDAQLQTIRKYSILLDDVEKATPSLWHAIAGAALLQNEYGVKDPEVLNAVRWHTTGHKGMTKLEKIVFLADGISEDRDYPDVEAIRAAADRSLDDGVLAMTETSIRYLLKKGALLHAGTVEIRNEILESRAKS